MNMSLERRRQDSAEMEEKNATCFKRLKAQGIERQEGQGADVMVRYRGESVREAATSDSWWHGSHNAGTLRTVSHNRETGKEKSKTTAAGHPLCELMNE